MPDRDRAAELQAILDRLGRRGGGALDLPAGTYTLSFALRVPSGVRVRGVGHATRLHAATPNQDILYLAGSRGASVEAVRFTGTGRTRVAGRGAVKVVPDEAGRPGRAIRVAGCWFEGLSTCAVVVAGPETSDVVVEGNLIDGVAEHGVYVSRAARCVVAGNTVARAGEYAVKLANARRCVVSGNVAAGCGSGVLLDAGTDLSLVVDNIIDGGEFGVRVIAGSGPLNRVAGNVIRGQSLFPVRVFGGGAVIAGNTLADHPNEAIYVDPPAQGVVIEGNVIPVEARGRHAIRLEGGADHVVRGNTIGKGRLGILRKDEGGKLRDQE